MYVYVTERERERERRFREEEDVNKEEHLISFTTWRISLYLSTGILYEILSFFEHI